jgi:hypothetical protein
MIYWSAPLEKALEWIKNGIIHEPSKPSNKLLNSNDHDQILFTKSINNNITLDMTQLDIYTKISCPSYLCDKFVDKLIQNHSFTEIENLDWSEELGKKLLEKENLFKPNEYEPIEEIDIIDCYRESQ